MGAARTLDGPHFFVASMVRPDAFWKMLAIASPSAVECYTGMLLVHADEYDAGESP
jgi:hypothetical protein